MVIFFFGWVDKVVMNYSMIWLIVNIDRGVFCVGKVLIVEFFKICVVGIGYVFDEEIYWGWSYIWNGYVWGSSVFGFLDWSLYMVVFGEIYEVLYEI